MKRLVPRKFVRTRKFLDDHGGLIAFLLVIFAGAIGLVTVSNQNKDIEKLTRANTKISLENRKALKLALRSLCDQKHSYQRQKSATIVFLFRHEHGVPGLLSAAELKAQIKVLDSRIKAYSDLNCPPSIPPKGNTQ